MHFVGWSATNREAGFLCSNGISARGERMAFQKIPEKKAKTMWSMRFVLYVFLTNLTGAFPVTVRLPISGNTHKRKFIL